MKQLKFNKSQITTGLSVAVLLAALGIVVAQGGDDTQPAPPSIGADIPLTYFGPAPSSVQKELVGPVQLLKSGTVDDNKGTMTLPLYRGQTKDGKNVWYVITDTNDKGNAEALGLNYSAKLTYTNVGKAVRSAKLEKNGTLTFASGTVDFSPEHVVKTNSSTNPFPPSEFKPGSVGDANYSPLVKVENAGGFIYNAPVIAFNVSAEQINFCGKDVNYKLVHDKVISICPEGNGGTVTLALTPGFSFAKPVLYLSFEANNALPAAMESATFAPALGDIAIGRDDSAFSGVERLFAIVNGPTGSDNPQRQGFNSALLGEGPGPLNVLGGIPTVATDYSPMWDLNVGEWTKKAVDAGYRSRVIEEFQVLGLVERGWITGPGGKRFGSTGFIVNCPIVKRFL